MTHLRKQNEDAIHRPMKISQMNLCEQNREISGITRNTDLLPMFYFQHPSIASPTEVFPLGEDLPTEHCSRMQALLKILVQNVSIY